MFLGFKIYILFLQKILNYINIGILNIVMEEKNHKKNYKTLAIVFITLFVLSWALFIGLITIGYQMQDNENQCSMNFCGEDQDAVSYSYDDMTGACYCYDSEQEITSKKLFS